MSLMSDPELTQLNIEVSASDVTELHLQAQKVIPFPLAPSCWNYYLPSFRAWLDWYKPGHPAGKAVL